LSLARFLLLLVVLVAAVIGGALLANRTVLPWIIHRQQAVLVPDLVGMKLEDAEKEAKRLGLGLEVGDEVFREGAEPGVVLEQAPHSMRSVRKGRHLRVVVSRGETFVQVPDLVGMSLRQCEITLARDGLKVGRVARSYDPVGRVGVAAQRPHALTRVPRGATVDVVLREQHESVYFRMPSLVGRSLVQVKKEVAQAGFELRRISYEKDTEVFPGTILRQWPRAGSRIVQGGGIELVASSR